MITEKVLNEMTEIVNLSDKCKIEIEACRRILESETTLAFGLNLARFRETLFGRLSLVASTSIPTEEKGELLALLKEPFVLFRDNRQAILDSLEVPCEHNTVEPIEP